MTLEQRIIESFEEILKEKFKYLKDPFYENFYVFEYFLDYNSSLSGKVIVEKLKEGYTKDDFYEYACELYSESIFEEEIYVTECLLGHLYKKDKELYEEISEEYSTGEIRELLFCEHGIVGIGLDVTKILYTEVFPINIMLENETARDHEFEFNSFSYYTIPEYIEHIEELSESEMNKNDFSLINLIESQEYTVDEFKDYCSDNLSNDNHFFNSLISEIQNTTSGCNSLIAHRYVTLDEYYQLLEEDMIEITKDDIVGYVSHVYGGGSLLEVRLEKSFKISKEFSKVEVDGSYGYGVTEIYGWLN